MNRKLTDVVKQLSAIISKHESLSYIQLNNDEIWQANWQLEDVFELVRNINFQVFVDRLEKYQTKETLDYWFGGKVEQVPNIKEIYKARDERIKSNDAIFDHYSSDQWPDPKYGIQMHLESLTKSLARNHEHLNKIRGGDTVWLNMELIGHLWGDSKSFIKYRSIFLNYDSTPPAKPTTSLDEMFANKKHLEKLVEQLTAKGFCKREKDGTLTWTGIEHQIAKTSKSQLIALAFLCEPFYVKTRYLQKELQQAWTSYFNISISPPMFSEGKRPGKVYNDLFSYLINSLRLP